MKTLKVTFDGKDIGQLRVPVLPDSGKPRLAPQWQYRRGDTLVFDPPCDPDNEHATMPCQVLTLFDGYMDTDDCEHYTAGGCYLVAFPCGCECNVFEHWLKRDDGSRTVIQ